MLSIVAAPIYTTTDSIGWFLSLHYNGLFYVSNLTGLQNAQIAGKTLFPGVPVGVSLVEISISVRLSKKGHLYNVGGHHPIIEGLIKIKR